MRRGKFSDQQIISILAEQEPGGGRAISCVRGRSQKTFYRWKSRYGGMGISDTRKPRILSDENARLKSLLTGRMLEPESDTMNYKTLRRLYREQGLAAKRRKDRKRALGPRRPMHKPTGSGMRLNLDFVSDVFGQDAHAGADRQL